MDHLKLFSTDENETYSIIESLRHFSKDIRMNFVMDKRAIWVIKRRKVVNGEDIQLLNDQTLKSFKGKNKYLGVLKSDSVLIIKMKAKIWEVHQKSKLNGSNLVKVVNTWAVSYSEVFLKAKLAKSDRTRKEFNMDGGLYPRAGVRKLYLPRKENGRG